MVRVPFVLRVENRLVSAISQGQTGWVRVSVAGGGKFFTAPERPAPARATDRRKTTCQPAPARGIA
jgi:hypothetical protein